MKVIKRFFQVDDMVALLGTLDKYVIDVNFHIIINLFLKDFVNQLLVDRPAFFRPKGIIL